MKDKAQRVTELKLLALQCFIAEVKLANLVFEWTERYNMIMHLDDVLKTKKLVNKINDLLDNLEASDECLQDDDPTKSSQNLRAWLQKHLVAYSMGWPASASTRRFAFILLILLMFGHQGQIRSPNQ